MARRVSIREKRREAPEWIYPWRHLGTPALPRWLAFAVVTLGFALLITSVRIRVTPPAPWVSNKASVIQAGDDAESRALVQKAIEGGPFPARFDLADWAESAGVAKQIEGALRWTPPVYQPGLIDLPKPSIPPVSFASAGKPVYPKRAAPSGETNAPAVLGRIPVISPLSPGAAKWMPRELPSFPDPVTADLADKPWRFLLRLESSGRVAEVFPLVSLEANKPSPLAWLRRVSFAPESNKPSRWIAVDLSFANQAAADGPDPR